MTGWKQRPRLPLSPLQRLQVAADLGHAFNHASALRVVPLFETLDDLDASGKAGGVGGEGMRE